MKFLGRIIFYIIVNALAIWTAARFVAGFIFQGDWFALLIAAVILTLINFFIRPLLKFFLGPLIVLTFGAFLFIINIITIFLLDKFSLSISINGLTPLILATIIISFVNILLNSSAKLRN